MELAIQLLDQFGANPDTYRIEVCAGFVNQPLREELRGLGYGVRVEEIKGVLQDKPEEVYREHVIEQAGSDVYYDPKDTNKSDIPRMYGESLKHGGEHCPHKVKAGWNATS